MNFDPSQIINLVGQLGGDHQQAAQQLQGVGQVDSAQHGGLLSRLGIDPQMLTNGGYQQHLDNQQQPGFDGYQPGQETSGQQPSFGTDRQSGGTSGFGGYQDDRQQGGGYPSGGYQDDQQQGGQQQSGGYPSGGYQDDQQQGGQQQSGGYPSGGYQDDQQQGGQQQSGGYPSGGYQDDQQRAGRGESENY